LKVRKSKIARILRRIYIEKVGVKCFYLTTNENTFLTRFALRVAAESNDVLTLSPCGSVTNTPNVVVNGTVGSASMRLGTLTCETCSSSWWMERHGRGSGSTLLRHPPCGGERRRVKHTYLTRSWLAFFLLVSFRPLSRASAPQIANP
jgi:hypothetical protein